MLSRFYRIESAIVASICWVCIGILIWAFQLEEGGLWLKIPILTILFVMAGLSSYEAIAGRSWNGQDWK